MLSARRLAFITAWAALALAGCKAEFTSGVTVCGQKEPRCPAGFACVDNLRCVAMGKVDVDRSDGGRDTSTAGTGGGGGGGGQTGQGGQGGTAMPPFTPPMSVDAAPVKDAAPPPDAFVAADAGATAIDASAAVDMAPIPTGQAVVKFCNSIRLADGNSLELELVIGSMRFKAATRKCAPVQGMPCTGMPAGPVTAQLFRDGAMLASQQVTLDQSGQYLFDPDVDATTQTFTLKATKLAVGQVCANFGFSPIAKVKFCNQLALNDASGAPAPVVLDLVIGTTKLTAGTGQCSTMDNLACAEVRAGQARLSLQHMGAEDAFAMVTLDPEGNYAVLGQFDPATKRPVLKVVPLPGTNSCASYKPPPPAAAPPPSDAGAGG